MKKRCNIFVPWNKAESKQIEFALDSQPVSHNFHSVCHPACSSDCSGLVCFATQLHTRERVAVAKDSAQLWGTIPAQTQNSIWIGGNHYQRYSSNVSGQYQILTTADTTIPCTQTHISHACQRCSPTPNQGEGCKGSSDPEQCLKRQGQLLMVLTEAVH